MRRTLSCLVVMCFVVASRASAQAQVPGQPVSATSSTGPTVEETLKSVREDLQGTRADIMAKNLTLTADQAAKFWPVFSAYQKEQNSIIEAQLRDIKTYVESYDTLSDAGALGLMQAHFARDTKM